VSAQALWQFSRPHTIIGTSASVWALFLMARAHAGVPPLQLRGLGLAALSWIACLCANVYIVGLNQLTDVALDRINKPHLPLASGALSLAQGRWLTGVCGAAALVLAVAAGGWLLLAVAASMAVGTAYSLPPLRLKRSHFWAAASIVFVRGALVNLVIFAHFHASFTGSPSWPPQVWLLAAFVIGFSVVIAWFKDIPDMEGDRTFEIHTLTLKWGPDRVFRAGLLMLGGLYLGLVLAGALAVPGVHGAFFVAAHTAVLAALWWKQRAVRPAMKVEMYRFYMFLWVLFFAEYLIYPAGCLLASTGGVS
jgi:homogentisate phytyltransferase/homogentisate geranylgeranyltransferase